MVNGNLSFVGARHSRGIPPDGFGTRLMRHNRLAESQGSGADGYEKKGRTFGGESASLGSRLARGRGRGAHEDGRDDGAR